MAEPITRRDVLLSWALAEALSTRWTERYEGTLQAGFASDPASLSAVEQALLLQSIQSYRSHLISAYIDPASRYELEAVPEAQIANLLLMPKMMPGERLTLGEYINIGGPNYADKDPRRVARDILEKPTPSPYFGFPIIAWDKDFEDYVIIEGYARLLYALLRLKRGDKLGNIVVIYCRK
jgi:hypothetical protein